MMALSASRGKWVVAALVGCALMVAALNFQSILLAGGIAAADRRPSLLSDAEWGKATSARKFGRRFAAGASEADLLAWLAANRFTVDRVSKSADRRIGGLPCAEHVQVTWSKDASGKLASASAQVSEGGCL
ncbi:MAG: hypothetical protein JWO81_3148 [Alphaproteobacteria bacterium]|nr:hypothetical protein [Alphaproteobacteria bacterium]